MTGDDKLSPKDKEQLIQRIQEAMDSLTKNDFIAIYEILLNACKRDMADLAEQMMIESINGEEE